MRGIDGWGCLAKNVDAPAFPTRSLRDLPSP